MSATNLQSRLQDPLDLHPAGEDHSIAVLIVLRMVNDHSLICLVIYHFL